MPEQRAPIGSVQTTVEIVEAVRVLDGPGVSAIAEELDLATSTVFDHLQTLEQNEFVKQADGYRIGPRFLDIGGYARKADPLYDVAEPELQKLAHKTGEHANLITEEFGKAVFYAKAEGQDAFQLDTHVGKQVHLATTSGGKAILAEFSDEQIESIIDEHGLPAVTEGLQQIAEASTATVRIPLDAVHVFDTETGNALHNRRLDYTDLAPLP